MVSEMAQLAHCLREGAASGKVERILDLWELAGGQVRIEQTLSHLNAMGNDGTDERVE